MAVALINNCNGPIDCEGWDIFNSEGERIAGGSGGTVLPDLGKPQEIGRWDVRDVPKGSYLIVARTDLGQFQARVSIRKERAE